MSDIFPFQRRPQTPSPGGVDLSWLDAITRRFAADSTAAVKTASFTPQSEIQWFRVSASGGAVTATVPLAASHPYRTIGFIKTDSGTNAVTLTRSGSDTINGETTLSLSLQYSFAILKSNGISAWDVAGKGGNFGVVAAGRATGQVAANASVSTFTVGSVDGSFEVSANVNVTTSTTHDITVTCAYTDEGSTARTLTLGFTQLSGAVFITNITNITGAGPYESPVYHIRCKAATAITFATTGTFTTVTYNVEGIIKRVN